MREESYLTDPRWEKYSASEVIIKPEDDSKGFAVSALVTGPKNDARLVQYHIDDNGVGNFIILPRYTKEEVSEMYLHKLRVFHYHQPKSIRDLWFVAAFWFTVSSEISDAGYVDVLKEMGETVRSLEVDISSLA